VKKDLSIPFSFFQINIVVSSETVPATKYTGDVVCCMSSAVHHCSNLHKAVHFYHTADDLPVILVICSYDLTSKNSFSCTRDTYHLLR